MLILGLGPLNIALRKISNLCMKQGSEVERMFMLSGEHFRSGIGGGELY